MACTLALLTLSCESQNVYSSISRGRGDVGNRQLYGRSASVGAATWWMLPSGGAVTLRGAGFACGAQDLHPTRGRSGQVRWGRPVADDPL